MTSVGKPVMLWRVASPVASTLGCLVVRARRH